MFQSFEVTAEPHHGAARVAALRGQFDALGIDAVLVPRADEFQGEYVPASAERLAWLTGFTGSAGVALVTRSRAVVFVDGRYTTQLAGQVDGAVFTAGDLVGQPPHAYLAAEGEEGLRLGIDPWLHTAAEVRRLEKALAARKGTLVFLPHNPVDRIWTDRPAEPLGAVTIQPYAVAGVLAQEKIATLAAGVAAAKADAVLVTDPSSIAWIFNLRGADVPHTPHPLGRALIPVSGKPEIFLDRRKTGLEVEAYLAQMARQQEPEALLPALARLAGEGKAVMVDPDLTPVALIRAIEAAGGRVVEAEDPARLPRACKNPSEIEGSAEAHVQDGVAMVEFLAWLDQSKPGTITEIEAVRQLEACRRAVGERMQNPLRDISFDTISGAGEHGAIIHYRVTSETDRLLAPGELFLVDSGGQYVNGTTDITRTVAIGPAGAEEKRFFTLVLKGMIAISRARFPKGTRGVDLDVLARIALWQAGANYAHGTGHGVGSYLSVHEGPQGISRRAMQELLPGMILSNEPGYYRPGQFGIRIENLLYVRAAEGIEGGDEPMLGFETLTWCPIDRALIVTALLTDDERRWIDDYHARTRDMLLPLVENASARHWLEAATRPL